MIRHLLLVAVWCLWSVTALAHKPSDSYLTLDTTGAVPTMRWDIALRDLEYALGLDADADGRITWGELQARGESVAAYALARLSVRTAQGACGVAAGRPQVARHSDGAYTVLPLELTCPDKGALTVDYRLFFDLDPSHRGLLRIVMADGELTRVLGPGQPSITVDVTGTGPWAVLADYWVEGVWHIWIGIDHILFLVALLLPTVLRRDNGQWVRVPALRPALLDVVGIVTAFTVAHSITLGLAVLGWVSLPGRWVESAIAATVVLVALNNLVPVIRRGRWALTFALGLIHGFGFASVLADLGLPAPALGLALVGFNLGVEFGQLAIVAVLVPLAYGLRGTAFYRRGMFTGGSVAVAGIGAVWLVERAFDVNTGLLPF